MENLKIIAEIGWALFVTSPLWIEIINAIDKND